MARVMQNKFLETLSPWWDFRIVLLFALCLGLGWLTDWPALVGVAQYMLPVIGLWALSLLLRATLRPGVSSRTLMRIASGHPLGAALVYCAHVGLLIAIALSCLLWWKG